MIRRFMQYAWALVAVGVAVLLQVVFWPSLRDYPFLLFVGSVTLTALYGGLGPTLLALALSVFAVEYLVVTPRVFSGSGRDLAADVAFLAVGLSIGAAVDARDRAVRRRLAAEETLRESEARERRRAAELAAVMDAVPGIVWVAHDSEGRRITGSRASYDLLRLPAGNNASLSADEEERPAHFRVYSQGKELEPHELPVQRAARGEEVRNFEEVVEFEDGTRRWLLGNATPLRDEGGRGQGAVACFIDITERKRTEVELRDARHLLSAVLDNTPVAVACLDRDFNFLVVNRNYARADGREPEFYPGRNHFELYPDDENESIFRRVVETGEPYAVEAKPFVYTAHPERGVSYWDWSLVPIRDEAGEVGQLVLTLADVTQRVRAEQALRESETEFRAMFELAGVGMAQREFPTGRFTRVNRKFSEITGYSEEDLLRTTGADITHPEDREADHRGIQILIEQGGKDWSREKRYVRPDGRTVWVQEDGALLRDGEGRPRRAVSVVQDITERRRAEEELRLLNQTLEERVLERTMDLTRSAAALRRSEERFRRLFEAAPDAVVIADNEGRIDLVNNQLEILFGYRSDELIGKSIDLLLPESLRAIHAGHRRAYAQEPRVRPMGEGRNLVGRRADGSEIAIEVMLSPLDTPEGMRVMAILRDITTRKRLEEALKQSERLAAIGQMMTGLSHESRNALQRSLACVEMLEKRVRDQAVLQRLVGEMRKAQEDLLQVYDNVQDYARPLHLSPVPMDVAEVWREAWDKLMSRRGRDAALIEEVDGAGLECPVDPQQLEQVFRNLFDNAMGAVSDPVRIRIACASEERESGSVLHIRVCDNGPGLPAELCERIFEPFFTTKTKGTGLGLSIVRRILEAHGGRVEAGVAPGGGLEVRMELPRPL